jgi:hypothetical protein
MKMTTQEAVIILENHNKWRRGDDTLEMAEPKDLGTAIELITEYFKDKKVMKTALNLIHKAENLIDVETIFGGKHIGCFMQSVSGDWLYYPSCDGGWFSLEGLKDIAFHLEKLNQEEPSNCAKHHEQEENYD